LVFLEISQIPRSNFNGKPVFFPSGLGLCFIGGGLVTCSGCMALNAMEKAPWEAKIPGENEQICGVF